MKRPTEFWATVVFALVVVYMTHDALAEQYAWEQPQTCTLNQSDWPCMDHAGCA